MNYKKLYEKQKELTLKLTEILVHVGLPGEYKPKYDLIKELSEVECNECKKFAKELSLIQSELSALKEGEGLIVPSSEDIIDQAENYASMEDSNRQHFIDGESYDGFIDGVNWAISEIKKLNQ